MNGQNFSQAAQGVSGQAPTTGSANNNALFFSSAAALLRALFAMQSFQNQLQKDYAQLEKETAEAYAGIGADGTIDGKSGVAAIIQTADIAVGQQQADGLTSQMWGSIASAGFGGACLLGMGGAGGYALYKNSPLNEQLADAEQFKTALNKPPASVEIEMRNPADLDNAVAQRVKDYEENVNIENFQGKGADGKIDVEQAQVNKEAADHIAARPAMKRLVLNNIQKRIDFLNGELSKISNQTQMTGQILQLLNSAGSSGGQAYGAAGQSTAARGQAQAQAQVDLEKQVQPQLTDQINQAMQQSTTWGKSSQDTAAAIYNTLSAMTHV
ncbi:MAG: hypothetical protein HY861_03180 [Chlamydiia bacterium]|nr:hypothetical protein [Chlamydiia bacterium]